MKAHLLDADQFEMWLGEELRGADDISKLMRSVEQALEHASVGNAANALQLYLLHKHEVLLALDAAEAWITRHIAMGSIRRPEGTKS